MPKRHEPQSLRENSLETIADNFDLLCYGKAAHNGDTEPDADADLLKVNNPFTDLRKLESTVIIALISNFSYYAFTISFIKVIVS